ncbi:ABC transporter permease [Sinorhizobium numidicum]|uniref:ABC transporter permease n=1 Tax=Sinorhizobium numidicum TaxID=680248 RepID=A0ABY8CS36_9HYPH|nr:ABC transporter permease [Sinorhizobium numidicum]WEX74155.1 ABC transporter permease [Sinorhizobium numidicum]WEX80140.1 ABC transporter permease [Sinorhizobium numidicum]
MISAGFRALLSHWRRRPLQLAMLLLGLCLATALWSGVQAINAEARASYDRAAALLGQDRYDQLVPLTGEELSQEVFVRLRRAGWKVSPVIEGEWRVGTRRIHLIGMDPVTLPKGVTATTLGDEADLLAFITPPGLVYAAPSTVAELKVTATPPLRASPDLLPGTAVADIGIAQGLLGKPMAISRLIVSPDQPMGRADLTEVAPELVLKKPDTQADLGRLTDSFHLNLTAFGFLAFVVGLFIVYSTIGLAFEQRRPTFRTLRSLGIPAGTLMALLVTELLTLAVVSGLIGVALGYLLATFLMPGVATTLRSLYGASVEGALAFRTGWVASGMAIAAGGTLLSAAQSLWQISRMPLLAPAQPRAWARASQRFLVAQSAVALVFLLLAMALANWGSGLIMGFSVLAFLLLGAALLLPGLLDLLLGLASRVVVRPVPTWFLADTRQQIPGLALALMALLIALSANVGVGTMVASFRYTFTGWLDQRLASELYVTARSEDEATRLAEWLGPRATAVLPIWNTEGEIEGQPGQVYGVLDHRTYRDNWPLLEATPDAWDQIGRGEAALVNEQLVRRNRLTLGDTVVLPGGWSVRIVGIYSDYGNPIGQALVSLDALTRHYPNVPRLRFGVRIPAGNVQALKRELTDEFGLRSANVVDQASLKRRSMEIFEQTFSITAALNVLTLGVAGVALFASMTTLSGMRLPQLAPVWAMGLTRRHLVKLELWRTMMLVTITLTLAVPVGISLAWVLLAVVNVEAFGWRLPLRLFPADWLRLGGFAVLAAVVSVAVPLRQLSKVTPSTLLKVFANER